MIDRNTHNRTTGFLVSGALVAGMLFGSNVLACTTGGFDADIPTPTADGPPVQARYQGVCSMKTAPAGGVKTISPNGETGVNGRFYILGSGVTGTPVVFEGFSDDNATSSLLSVTFDGTNFVFEAGSTASSNIPGSPGWNSVEFEWLADSTMRFWVNTDSDDGNVTETGSVTSVGTGMESVILGAPASATGSILVDSLELRRTSLPGRLTLCDANNDDTVNFNDILALVSEVFAQPKVYAEGTPDCNEDGTVNFNDILVAVGLVWPNP